MTRIRDIRLALVLLIILAAAVWPAACRVAEPEGNDEEIEHLQQQVDSLQQEVQMLGDRLTELESSQMIMADGRAKVVAYLGYDDGTNAYTIPVLRPANDTDNLKEAALQQMIEGPAEDSPLFTVAPPETQILGLEVEQGTATVDFSSEIATYAEGSTGETLVIAAIVNTLSEFPDIDQVVILVEGEEGVSLGGHYVLSEPLERFEDMIP